MERGYEVKVLDIQPQISILSAMPIYEYHCGDCGKDHEIIQKFSEEPLTICPACGGSLKKKLSLSAFHLKGGGWYKEGYASKKTERAAEKKGETAPKKEEAKKTPETPAPQKKTEK